MMFSPAQRPTGVIDPKPFDAALKHLIQDPPEFIQSLFAGVRAMKESSTYQAILEEGRSEGVSKGLTAGRIEGVRAALLRIGRKHLGQPDAATLATIEAMQEVRQLEEWTERLLAVASWPELLAPRPRRNGKRRKPQ